jgi:hypothetical protein
MKAHSRVPLPIQFEQLLTYRKKWLIIYTKGQSTALTKDNNNRSMKMPGIFSKFSCFSGSQQKTDFLMELQQESLIRLGRMLASPPSKLNICYLGDKSKAKSFFGLEPQEGAAADTSIHASVQAIKVRLLPDSTQKIQISQKECNTQTPASEFAEPINAQIIILHPANPMERKFEDGSMERINSYTSDKEKLSAIAYTDKKLSAICEAILANAPAGQKPIILIADFWKTLERPIHYPNTHYNSLKDNPLALQNFSACMQLGIKQHTEFEKTVEAELRKTAIKSIIDSITVITEKRAEVMEFGKDIDQIITDVEKSMATITIQMDNIQDLDLTTKMLAEATLSQGSAFIERHGENLNSLYRPM